MTDTSPKGPISTMRLADLRAYAEELGIELSPKAKRPEIQAAIREVLPARRGRSRKGEDLPLAQQDMTNKSADSVVSEAGKDGEVAAEQKTDEKYTGPATVENWLAAYAEEVAEAVKNGLQVAIVIGGGNIFRGLQGVGKGFDRVNGDKMGMLATVINSLGLAMAIRSAGVEAEVFTATPMMPVARYYMRDDAVAVMEKGGVALIAGGTGNPYFTTDSGAALRALEIGADALLKGTRVDGVYTADPEKDPNAVKYEELSFDKAIEDRLKVMDQTAFALCREGNMPIIVFDMNQKGNLTKLVKGEKVGTLVHV